MTWAEDGAASGAPESENGSAEARKGARTAITSIADTQASPINPAGRLATAMSVVESRNTPDGSAPAGASSAETDAWIDGGMDQIGQEVGDDHRK